MRGDLVSRRRMSRLQGGRPGSVPNCEITRYTASGPGKIIVGTSCKQYLLQLTRTGWKIVPGAEIHYSRVIAN